MATSTIDSKTPPCKMCKELKCYEGEGQPQYCSYCGRKVSQVSSLNVDIELEKISKKAGINLVKFQKDQLEKYKLHKDHLIEMVSKDNYYVLKLKLGEIITIKEDNNIKMTPVMDASFCDFQLDMFDSFRIVVSYTKIKYNDDHAIIREYIFVHY